LPLRPGNPSDVPEISRAYVESWRTTYEGWVPEPFLEGMTEAAAAKIFTESLLPNQYSYFLHVVEVNKKIIGFADGGKERSHPEKGIGELYAVYLLKDYQGQGLGRALFEASVKSLREAGMKSMVVWVLEQSPARRFYEVLGGKLQTGTKKLDIVGHPIKLVSYRWDRS
jgi:GNAT superfamily N-acetyltransferase